MIGLIITDEKISLIPLKNRSVPIIAVLMTALTFIEWGIEFVLNADIPAGRIITGLLAGAGIALLLQYFITKEYEKVVFERD